MSLREWFPGPDAEALGVDRSVGFFGIDRTVAISLTVTADRRTLWRRFIDGCRAFKVAFMWGSP